MAFTDFDIIEYFQGIFLDIGIPENNIHIYNTDARLKEIQNTPSILISIVNESIEPDNQWIANNNTMRLNSSILRNWKRRIEVEIKITTHIDENQASDWHIGKIMHLFLGMSGLNRNEFDVGDDTDNADKTNGKRCAVIESIRGERKYLKDTSPALLETILTIPVIVYEHSTQA